MLELVLADAAVNCIRHVESAKHLYYSVSWVKCTPVRHPPLIFLLCTIDIIY